ncbi:uncharacterized protein LOC110722970 [Chenopodium quinoa]|uniref:uncharacterized protein LOC110722970 n=1 Tax=Chenopodium quinoa TaxID=63459 RepID=UPI000B78A850|nr:uncharacterized protein LOC110722970 [Chenopodium quinoa]
MEINALAVKLLHCGLGPHEHNCVMGCKNAKEIWDLLQVTYEGTNEVRHSKIDLLRSKHERFEMQPKETIQEMLTRWRAKVTALQETKDFTKFNIEQLAGSLMTHKLHLGTSNNEGNKGKGLALKASNPEDFEVDEEEAAMLVIRFKIMFNRNNKTRKGKAKEQNKSNKTPFNKTDIRKAMIAAWGDSESEDEEEQPEEETSNLCLMAKRDEKAYNEELAKDVFVDPNHLRTLPKEVRIDFILEMEDDWRIDIKKLNECEKDLKVYKEHNAWIENQHTDIQGRFFDLFDKNLHLKEINEKLKYENIIVNVELSQYKLASADLNRQVPLLNHCLNVLVRGNNTWYLDSGCSKHMTGDKSKCLSLEAYSGGTVTFGVNKKE